jgi:hypothetical protein
MVTAETKEAMDLEVKDKYFASLPECKGKNPFIYDALYERCFNDRSPQVGFNL